MAYMQCAYLCPPCLLAQGNRVKNHAAIVKSLWCHKNIRHADIFNAITLPGSNPELPNRNLSWHDARRL